MCCNSVASEYLPNFFETFCKLDLLSVDVDYKEEAGM